MLRPEQFLHSQRAPVAPLQASTLLLLRDTPAPDSSDWQVLMTRRSEKASFVPGHYVFPGGGIEPQDAMVHAQALYRPDMSAQELAAAIAAVRESFEEMGLLLAVHTDGQPVVQADIDRLDRRAPLWPQLQTHGLLLDMRGVWQLAHWTADRGLPRRFAVPFFVARAPQAQTPVADESEQFEPVWVQPVHALRQSEAGQMPMIFPTIRTLERLTHYSSVQAILDTLAQQGPLWQSCPRSGLVHGQLQRFMEDEAPYGELAMVCPDGQIPHALEWQSTRAVPLRKNLLRLTAPNANVMTGPGTNSYLVGEQGTGYIAIDPGPADEVHIDRLFHAAGGDIRHIVCTHSHADHSPGAFILQALCVAQGRPRPLIYGLPSASTARPNSYFVPDKAVHDGQCVTLFSSCVSDHTRHTLRVIHTPGHAANHICLLLQEDALLFTGDHILNGSTTVIDVPDGNMADYLDSLDKLDGICARHSVEFLLPAHGHVLGDGRGVIARLKTHRLTREAKIIDAMRQKADGSLRDWVALAYADTPASLWPLAERSLKAHVERIRALGLLQD